MFRRDIEGLRAIAVIFVVLYHAGFLGLTGGFIGVDVFFVVSGFLITTLLLDEHRTTGRISLRNFYARRARRLLPASAIVIVATVLASRQWLEPLRLRDVGTDAMASGGFFANIIFAARSTDYLQSDLPPSPFLHFWSLSVEEQYYIIWPALLGLLLWSTWKSRGNADDDDRRRAQRRAHRRATAAIALISAISLALCIWQTETAQPWAFFGLHTRAWELGVGALLALTWKQTSTLESGLRSVVGWIGIAGITISAFFLDETMAFPGRLALLPVFGTALVLLAGDRTRFGPQVLLRLAPLQWIGARSYAIYLWHWPALIIAEAYAGGELDVADRIAVLAVAVGAATLSHQLVENPIRHARALRLRPGMSLGIGGLLVIGSVTAGFVLRTSSVALSTDEIAETPAVIVPTLPQTTVALPGFGTNTTIKPAIPDGPPPPVLSPTTPLDVLNSAVTTGVVPANLTPSLRGATGDKPVIYADNCHVDIGSYEPARCSYGDPNSDFSVALFGDSHAAQWFPTLNQVATQHSWRLVPLTKTGCTPIDLITYNSLVGPTYPECRPWRERVMQRLIDENIKVVFIGYSNRLQDPNTKEPFRDSIIAAGFAELIPTLQSMGISPIVITDTPYPGQDVPICLSKALTNVPSCTFLRTQGIRESRQQTNIAVAVDNGAEYLDISNWVCATEICPVISGNLLMYRDSNHITTTYAEWLTPFFDDAVSPYVNGLRLRLDVAQ